MIVTLAVRVLQLLFAVVVLALSIVLIKGMGPVFDGQTVQKAPSLIDYGAFCGGAGIVIAVVGVAAAFFEPIQGIIMAVLDALAAFFLVAGGIAFAVTTKVGSCADDVYLSDHPGTFFPSYKDSQKSYGYSLTEKTKNKYNKDLQNDVTGRCRMVQASTAFIWFMFACFLATTALSFMARSRGGGRSAIV